MRLCLSALVCLAFFLCPVQAQQIPEFDRDLAQQLKIYLNKAPESHFRIELSPSAPFPIPDSTKNNIRFGFQKRMALSGHGILFDIEGNRVELDAKEIDAISDEMLQAVMEEKATGNEKNRDAIAKLEEFAKSALATDVMSKRVGQDVLHQRFLGIEALAWRLDDPMQTEFRWRTQYLRNRLFELELPPRDALIQIDRQRLRELLDVLFNRTAYMNDCHNAGVPVPPDFSVNSTAWTHQGNLSQNILDPGNVAQVWTWASPQKRGACVALPRRSGGPGNVAGIICQGAQSGNACFWDNIDRATGQLIPWANNTLVIKNLEDATNLADNCTRCHTGNNVYLVSPDDPTWCKLLRGGRPGSGCAAPGGADAANLSLQVESPVNPIGATGSVFHARYSPLSGTPSRPGWSNNAQPGCGGICHLEGSQVTPPNPMPPNCGSRCN